MIDKDVNDENRNDDIGKMMKDFSSGVPVVWKRDHETGESYPVELRALGALDVNELVKEIDDPNIDTEDKTATGLHRYQTEISQEEDDSAEIPLYDTISPDNRSMTSKPRRLNKPYDEVSTIGFGDLASKISIGDVVTIIKSIDNASIGDDVIVEKVFPDGILGDNNGNKCFASFTEFRKTQGNTSRSRVKPVEYEYDELELGVAASLGFDLTDDNDLARWKLEMDK